MKRLLVPALAALLAAASVRADDIPHLDFARQLRARGLTDLALEYLEKELPKHKPSPEVAALVPLEIAKVRLDLANAETNTGLRLELYNKARAELKTFIDKNPANPLVADARLEMTRVTGLVGRTQLSRALRQDNPQAADNDALAARGLFAQAAKELVVVIGQLEQQLGRYADPKTPRERAEKAALEQARLRAEIDLGMNYIDQAQTYLDETKTEVLQARSEVIKQAIPVLEKASTRDLRNPLCWQARAWLGHCYHQNGDPTRALKILNEVIEYSDPAAAVGRRLAFYLRLRVAIDPPATPDAKKLSDARTAAERWLSDYRNFLTTPEGFAVRYLLAKVNYDLGAAQKDRAARAPYFNRARELCRELERVENDFTEKARLIVIHIVRAEGGFEKEIAKLATFDDCLVRAQYEAFLINELANKKDPKPDHTDSERKQRLENVVEALRRGLTLAQAAGSRVPPSEVSRARSMLAGYYLFTGRYKEAIAVGEEAARARPATSQSAATAVYVLQAYADLISSGLREGMMLDDLAEERQKMRLLAEYMEQTWPGEHAGDLARHQLALLLMREKKPAEAVEVFGRISPGYAGAIFVKYQTAKAAFEVAQDRAAVARTEPDKARREQAAQEERLYEQKAVAALRAMPPLPAGADPLTVATFLQARIELGRVLYRDRQYAELEQLIDPLLADLKDGRIKLDSEARQAEAQTNLVILKLYARYGLAAAAFAAGEPARVKEITGPIVDAIKKGEYAELKKDPTLRWGLMGLALRVSIQEGNTPRAQEILQALQQVAAADEGEGAAAVILQQLVVMVKDQVRDIRKKKDKELLDKTLASFGAFLDEVSKQQKSPAPELLRVLADAYASLGKHDRAVELARRVPEPKGEDGQPPDARKLGNYHYCRLLAVRELRLDGKLDDAEKALEEVRAQPWGKNNLEAEKERIHLIAARGKPALAYTEWNKLVSSLVRRISQPGIKEQYFECYFYYTECYLKWGLSQEAGPKRDDAVKRSANLILRLEKSWPDLGGEESRARFEDLLEREPLLKEQYDKLKEAR